VERQDEGRRLERAIAGFARRWRAARAPRIDAVEALTPEAFRAVVAQRLQALERDVAELRTRINGLLFVVAGAVVTQVLLRVAG
jgi:hypothetical protein